MASELPGAVPERAPRLSARHLRRYILPGERVVVATRAHWGKLAEPVATTAAAFLLVAWLVNAVGPTVGDSALLLWWAWLVVALRLLWKVLDWRNEWFVATDKRMLLMFGLVTHKVAMMPLGKVTDMSYSRSVVGRVLGYGQFILESAGQDQAMSRINWVADPDATYRRLCDTIFIPGGRGGPWAQHTYATAAPSAAPPAASTLPPAPAPGPGTSPGPPQPASAGLAWAPTGDGPQQDPSATATQPLAVRSPHGDGRGRLFVVPRGSTPRLAGTDGPRQAPAPSTPPRRPTPTPAPAPVPVPVPPRAQVDLTDGDEGETEGPAWEVSDDERGTFVPVAPVDPRSGWRAPGQWERPQTADSPSGPPVPPVPPPPA